MESWTKKLKEQTQNLNCLESQITQGKKKKEGKGHVED